MLSPQAKKFVSLLILRCSLPLKQLEVQMQDSCSIPLSSNKTSTAPLFVSLAYLFIWNQHNNKHNTNTNKAYIKDNPNHYLFLKLTAAASVVLVKLSTPWPNPSRSKYGTPTAGTESSAPSPCPVPGGSSSWLIKIVAWRQYIFPLSSLSMSIIFFLH